MAVALCTTMVLVVISVMGGWLDMFEHSFQGLTGDIVVESRNDSLVGFPYYQEMIDRMLQQPGIAAAVPSIHTFGIINIESQYTMGVQVMGLPIDKIGQVRRGTVLVFPTLRVVEFRRGNARELVIERIAVL